MMDKVKRKEEKVMDMEATEYEIEEKPWTSMESNFPFVKVIEYTCSRPTMNYTRCLCPVLAPMLRILTYDDGKNKAPRLGWRGTPEEIKDLQDSIIQEAGCDDPERCARYKNSGQNYD